MTNFNIEVQKCVEILNNGGIILYPTDTIYGIGSDSHNNQAIDRINKLKGSDSKKPLIHLMNSLEMVERYVKKIPDFAKEYLNDKSPTTVIFSNLNKEKLDYETLGIRIPKNNFCLEIIKKLNRPITSTSANITGSSFPIKNTDIDKNIIDGVDYYVKSITSDKKIPSKIIKVLNENNFEIIRS